MKPLSDLKELKVNLEASFLIWLQNDPIKTNKGIDHMLGNQYNAAILKKDVHFMKRQVKC